MVLSKCALSTLSDFKNLRRAGVLKNKSLISIVVPLIAGAAAWALISPPAASIIAPPSSSLWQEEIFNLLTAARE